MVLILMDTFRTCFGLTDVAAATEAGLVVGYNERSIRIGVKSSMIMMENFRNHCKENIIGLMC